ncbi:MAG: leucine-rich repeat protein [Clostridia bacterium]|nr:leucine-rich repeat protein [Clostridia bacterium]
MPEDPTKPEEPEEPAEPETPEDPDDPTEPEDPEEPIMGTITINSSYSGVEITVYQVVNETDILIESGNINSGKLVLNYGALNFDTTGAKTIYDVEFKEIKIKIKNNSSTKELGAYFWNKQDTNELHAGEDGFVLNAVPKKAKIETRQSGSGTIEMSDILYGHKQYNLGTIVNAVDYEYEFYNHVSAVGMMDNPYYEEGVAYLTIYVRILKLEGATKKANIPIYLNIEEYEPDELIISDDIIANSGFVRTPYKSVGTVENGHCFCKRVGGLNSNDYVSNTSVTHIVFTGVGLQTDSYCFKNCTSLKAVGFTAEISIDRSAFEGCSSLQSIILCGRSGSLSNSVFKDCTSLKSIVIPNGTNKTSSNYNIQSNCFENCVNLIFLNFGSGLKNINSRAFRWCSNIVSVVFPTLLRTIDAEAFYECINLKKAIFDSSSSITFGNSAFYNTSLEGEFHISKSFKFGGTSNSPFDCTNIERFTLDIDDTRYMSYNNDGCVYKRKSSDSSSPDYNVPNYLEFYPDGSKNTVYTIPATVTDMRRFTLPNAKYIQMYNVEAGNTKYGVIDGVLYDVTSQYISALCCPYDFNRNPTIGGTGSKAIYNLGGVGTATTGYGFGSALLNSITINNPSSIHIIAGDAFQDSTLLKRINSNTDGVFDLSGFTSLTTIGYKAFQHCENLTTLKLPSSLTTLGDGVVQYAYSLRQLYLYNTSSVVKLSTNQYTANYQSNFYNSDIVIHVPSTMLEAYKTSTYWSALADNIVGDL